MCVPARTNRTAKRKASSRDENGSRELAAVKTRAVIQAEKPAPKSSEKWIDLQKSPERDRGTRKAELTGQNIQRREYQRQNQNLRAEENQREPTALITKRQNLAGAVFMRSNKKNPKPKLGTGAAHRDTREWKKGQLGGKSTSR
jgi:hypothetical protein